MHHDIAAATRSSVRHRLQHMTNKSGRTMSQLLMVLPWMRLSTLATPKQSTARAYRDQLPIHVATTK